MPSHNPCPLIATALSLIMLAAPAAAQQPDKPKIVDDETLESVVENVTEKGKLTDVGEASYNIEDCQALIDAKENGDTAHETDAEVAPLDLDRCKEIVK